MATRHSRTRDLSSLAGNSDEDDDGAERRDPTRSPLSAPPMMQATRIIVPSSVRVIDLDDPLTSARDTKATVTSLLHALGALGPPAERVVRVIQQAIAKYVPTSTLSSSAQRSKFADFFPEEDGDEPAAVKWADLTTAERALDSSFAHVLAMYFTGSRLTLHDDYAFMLRRSAVFVSHLWEHFIAPDIVASKLSMVSAMAALSDPADSASEHLLIPAA